MSDPGHGPRAPGYGAAGGDSGADVTPLQVTSLGGGRYQIRDGSIQHMAFAVQHSGSTWVFLEGRVHLIQAPAAGGGRPPRHDEESALAAPMPATVVTVNVVQGQEVARGDVLIMLEAMKMELAIKAPRDGVIKRVACRAGELVQPGVRLVELE